MCYKTEWSAPDLLSVAPPQGVPYGIQTFAPLYGKVLTKKDGQHFGGQGMRYDLRRLVVDANAVINSHDNCIHLVSRADENTISRDGLGSYGSHVLATIPSRNLWGVVQDGRSCHHTDATFPVVCLTCEGVDVEELTMPEFQQSVGMKQLALPPGLTIVGFDPIRQRFQKVDSTRPVNRNVQDSLFRVLN